MLQDDKQKSNYLEYVQFGSHLESNGRHLLQQLADSLDLDEDEENTFVKQYRDNSGGN